MPTVTTPDETTINLRTYRTAITRQELIEVAERMLDMTEGVSAPLAADLRRIARTATRVAGGLAWWYEAWQCGCLIGHILHGEPPRDTVERTLGANYIMALTRVIGVHSADRSEVLEVID